MSEAVAFASGVFLGVIIMAGLANLVLSGALRAMRSANRDLRRALQINAETQLIYNELKKALKE